MSKHHWYAKSSARALMICLAQSEWFLSHVHQSLWLWGQRSGLKGCWVRGHLQGISIDFWKDSCVFDRLQQDSPKAYWNLAKFSASVSVFSRRTQKSMQAVVEYWGTLSNQITYKNFIIEKQLRGVSQELSTNSHSNQGDDHSHTLKSRGWPQASTQIKKLAKNNHSNQGGGHRHQLRSRSWRKTTTQIKEVAMAYPHLSTPLQSPLSYNGQTGNL